MWNKVSEDERLYNEEQHRKLKVNPPSDVVKALDDILSWCVSQLGVDCSYPVTISGQQDVLGINVVEITSDHLPDSPRAWGFVIVQNLVEKFFIKDPYFSGKDIYIDALYLPSEELAKRIILRPL